MSSFLVKLPLEFNLKALRLASLTFLTNLPFSVLRYALSSNLLRSGLSSLRLLALLRYLLPCVV